MAGRVRLKPAKVLASTWVKSKYFSNVLGFKSKYIAVFRNEHGYKSKYFTNVLEVLGYKYMYLSYATLPLVLSVNYMLFHLCHFYVL